MKVREDIESVPNIPHPLKYHIKYQNKHHINGLKIFSHENSLH